MRYRLYYHNPSWHLTGDCWEGEDPEKCCPAEKPEDLIIVKRLSEENYWLSLVPKEFRGTLSHMAYERGHAYGEAEVMLVLSDLCTELAPAIKEFEKRVLREK